MSAEGSCNASHERNGLKRMLRAIVPAVRRYNYIISPVSYLARSFIRRLARDGLVQGEMQIGADIGAGVAPYQKLVMDRFGLQNSLSIDLFPSDKTDIIADARSIPFQDASLDILMSFDVLQHIPNVAQAPDEIARVVRPGGYVMFSFPFLYGECDVHDFYRWTQEGMHEELVRRHFSIVKSEKRGGALFAVACMIQRMIHHLIPGSRKNWRTQRTPLMILRQVIVTLLILPIVPVSWIALVLDKMLPAGGYYMGGLVFARKLEDDA